MLLISNHLTAQVQINEAVSSNSTHEDEDGDTPDWFELYNPGPAKNLVGWSVTDDAEEPRQWVLPSVNLDRGEHLLLWASDKNRHEVGRLVSYVQGGDEARFLVPTDEVPDDWNTTDFDDSAWALGETSIGNGGADLATMIPATVNSLFLRHSFNVADAEAVTRLVLDVDYEDGFIAYLNGTEILVENMEDLELTINTPALSDTDSRLANNLPLLRTVRKDVADLLVTGHNVLAIRVHAATPDAPSLRMLAYLSAHVKGADAVLGTPPDFLKIVPPGVHTNFKISSRGETLYLYDPAGTLADEMTVGNLPADVSLGIPPSGEGSLVYEQTTPGYQNPDSGFDRAIGATVDFSSASGNYSSADDLYISMTGAPPGTEIRYTLDATVPTDSSTLYTGPVLMPPENKVLRARIMAAGAVPSRTTTATYLRNASHDLDVITLVADPDDLFSEVDGIYSYGNDFNPVEPYFGANFWQDKEIPAQFDFLTVGGGENYSSDFGLKIFGNYSRANDQRSFSLFARGRYGNKDFHYPFFEKRIYDEFQALTLRNSGNEWLRTMLRDATLSGLMEGTSIDFQAYRPVATYINGHYWGLYNLREKVNEHFLASRHGIHADSIDIIQGRGRVVEGSNTEYMAMYDFIANNDLTQEANYRAVEAMMDVENYVLYNVAQIFWYNRDWPANNNKHWKKRGAGSKWRWIMYDLDLSSGSFGHINATVNSLALALATDGPSWPNPAWSTLMLRKLCANTEFRHRFVNQFADEMNTRFLTDNIIRHIDNNAQRIETEIPRAFARWRRGNTWRRYLEGMKSFFRQRPPMMKLFIKQQWNLPEHHPVTVKIDDPVVQGFVQLNSLTLEDTTWTGDYFQDVPISVTAIPREGYSFSHWETGSVETSPELTVYITGAHTFKPVFLREPVISAINSGYRFAGLGSVSNVRLTPNPATGPVELSFELSSPSTLLAELYSVDGRRVHTFFSEKLAAGAHAFSTDLGNLPAGAYTLRITQADGRSGSVVWVRQ